MASFILRPLMRYVLTALLAFAFFGWIQFSVPELPEYDGYYHARMAQLLLDNNFLPIRFPYLPLTILSETEFADHHFLFHAAIAPFLLIGDEMIMAKVAAVVFAGVMVVTFYFLLLQLEIRWPLLWVAVLLAGSEPFLYRMSMLRAQSLGAALLMFGFWLTLKRRKWSLFVTGAVFAWLYAAFPILAAVVGLAWAGDSLSRKHWEPRLVVYALTGMTAGTIIHPYSPQYLVFVLRHAGTKMLGYSPVAVGNEWYPYNAGFIFESHWLILGCFLAGLMFTARGPENTRGPRYAAALVSIMFFILFLQHRRFVEYWPPFVVLLAALTVGPQLWLERVGKPWITVMLLTAAAILAPLAGHTALKTAAELHSENRAYLLLEAGRWIDAHAQVHEHVFHADWDDFPHLFFAAPKQTYLIGLDPLFGYMKDTSKYEQYERVTRTGERAVDVIRNGFGARIVFLTNDHTALLNALRADPRAHESFQSNCCSIFELQGAPGSIPGS